MAWSQICGQQLAVTMLQADLAKQRVVAAYLFAGPEGVGKRLAALELARALICEGGSGESCGQCDHCRRMQRGTHPDLHQLVPQGSAKNIRIDDVRRVLERVHLRPFMARRQVVILDGAECLTDEAGNLLLKSLEEPPGHAAFVLISAQPSACLPTIVSRCKVVRFGRLSAQDLAALLTSQQTCQPETAQVVSRLAQGSLAKAAARLQRWEASRAMLAQFASEQPVAWLEWPIPTDREAVSQWLDGAIAWLRDVAVAGVGGDTLLTDPETAPQLQRQASTLDQERCVETALRLVELSHSLDEQMISARLIGTLFREEWLDLTR